MQSNISPLQWRHNVSNGVSNYRHYDCLLNRLFMLDQRKQQISASLTSVRGLQLWPVNSPHKWPVTRKMFSLDNHNMTILQLYKTWGYYNNFDSTKSMGAYCWYVKIQQWGYMDHGLKDIAFYVQKHTAPRAVCYNYPLVRDKPLGTPAYVRVVYIV